MRETPFRNHKLGGDRATYLTGRSEVDNFYSFHVPWDFSSLLFGERHLHLGKGIYILMLCSNKDIKLLYTCAAVESIGFVTNALVEILNRMPSIFVKKLGVISDLTKDS